MNRKTAGATTLRRLDTIFDSPELFPTLLDFDADRVRLAPMTAAAYARPAFLDARSERGGELGMSLSKLVEVYRRLAPPRRPVHFLFHIGHCGSTLLSRMLGETGGLLSLREPATLLELAQQRRALRPGADDAWWSDALDLTLHLLSRTFVPGDTALVKPNSHANNLLGPLMGWQPSNRAILLHVDLDTYLATMLRPAARRETARAVADSRLADFRRYTGNGRLTEGELDDSQKAALVWLVQMREFVDALESPALHGRLQPLEFGALLAGGRKCLARAAGFLGAAADSAGLNRAFAPALVQRHSKHPAHAFDADARAGMLDDARRAHAVEIAAGKAWAASVCERHHGFRALAAGTLPGGGGNRLPRGVNETAGSSVQR